MTFHRFEIRKVVSYVNSWHVCIVDQFGLVFGLELSIGSDMKEALHVNWPWWYRLERSFACGLTLVVWTWKKFHTRIDHDGTDVKHFLHVDWPWWCSAFIHTGLNSCRITCEHNESAWEQRIALYNYIKATINNNNNLCSWQDIEKPQLLTVSSTLLPCCQSLCCVLSVAMLCLVIVSCQSLCCVWSVIVLCLVSHCVLSVIVLCLVSHCVVFCQSLCCVWSVIVSGQSLRCVWSVIVLCLVNHCVVSGQSLCLFSHCVVSGQSLCCVWSVNRLCLVSHCVVSGLQLPLRTFWTSWTNWGVMLRLCRMLYPRWVQSGELLLLFLSVP